MAIAVEPPVPDGFRGDFEEDLRRDRSRVLAVVGAGVSIATTNGASVASWRGLLEHGIDYCLAHKFRDAEWRDRWQGMLSAGDPGEMLLTAEQVQRTLTTARDGEYGRWLETTLGKLEIEDSHLLEVIGTLGVTIATTNYDDLIERVTGLTAATWQDTVMVEQVLRGDYRAVIHLHGVFRRPGTTVLGLRSYLDVVGDQKSQGLLRAAFRDRTVVFIGCGDGLNDPNLGSLRAWLREVAGDSPYRHYRLVTTEEATAPAPLGDLVAPVVYGDAHTDLVGYLAGLATSPTREVLRRRERPVLELTVASNRVTAIARPGGEEQSTDLRLDAVRATMVAMLEERLREREDGDDEQEQAEARLLGRILYEAVFNGDVRKLYERRRDALAPGERLAVVLRVAPKLKAPLLDDDGDLVLAGLPWEVLYGHRGWLALDKELTLLRALPGPAARDAATDERLRVLAVTVQPPALLTAARASWPAHKWQNYERALSSIHTTLEGVRAHESVQDLRIIEQPTEKKLAEVFVGPETDRPNVLHYIGFGRRGRQSAGQIALLGEDGEVSWESYTKFADRCQGLRLRLVFLHMCEGPSGTPGGDEDFRHANFAHLARALLEKGAQVVVAMQYPLLPDVGATFTESFYTAVRNNRTTVGEAVQTARIRAAMFYRLGGPVLYLSQANDATLMAAMPDDRAPGTAAKGPVAGQASRLPESFPPTGRREVAAGGLGPNGGAAVQEPSQRFLGHRTFAGLRVLATPVARELGLETARLEHLLAIVWRDCGSGTQPVPVTKIRKQVVQRYDSELDTDLQQFWLSLYERLSPGSDPAGNDA